MLVRIGKIVTLCVVALAAVVISLPVISYAATSPTVTVLSPLVEGFRAPVKMVLDARGNMYVADRRVRGVVKLDSFGKPLMTIRTESAPSAVAFAQDGSLLVAQDSVVVRHNADSGDVLGRFVGGQLKNAFGIAVNSVSGYVYVVDAGAKQIEVYTASGQYVSAFGSGMLSSPAGIAFEKISGQLAVADTSSNKVHFFDVNGNYAFIKSIGNIIPGGKTSIYSGLLSPMQFMTPVAVAYEYSKDGKTLNRMYVVDSYQGNVQVVDPATMTALNVVGTSKNYIGSVGAGSGQLMTPSDVVFDLVNGRLLVVNSGIANVAVYGIDGGKNPTDITPPTLSIDPLISTVQAPNITVTGKVEAGATVLVSGVGSTLAGAVVYPTETTWKSDITGLAPGENTITVIAKDAVGNTTQPQTVSTTYRLPAPDLKILSTIPNLTNISIVDVSGTVDEGSSVTVVNSATSVNSTVSVTGNVWSCKVALVEGANGISVVAEKVASDKSTATVTVELDTTPPSLVVSALSDGSFTSNQVQNITGTVSDSSLISVLVNNLSVALVNGTFSVPVELATGENKINVVAFDLAGNKTENSRTINFDATKPVITIAAPMDNSFTNIKLQTVSGTVDKESTVAVAGVSAVVVNSNWTSSVELVAGTQTIEVTATDLYGNISAQKRTITLDDSNPVLAIESPTQDTSVSANSIAIAGTVRDNTDMSLTYKVNAGVSVPVTVANGSFNFNVIFTNEGTYAVTLTATDAAGNSTSTTRSLIYKIVNNNSNVNKNDEKKDDKKDDDKKDDDKKDDDKKDDNKKDDNKKDDNKKDDNKKDDNKK